MSLNYNYRDIDVLVKGHCYDKQHKIRIKHQIVNNNVLTDYGIKLLENTINEMYRTNIEKEDNDLYVYSNVMFGQGFIFKYYSDNKKLIMRTVLPQLPNHKTHKKNTDKKLFIESISGKFDFENLEMYSDSINAVENMFDTFGIDFDYIETHIDKEEYYDYIDINIDDVDFARIYFVEGDLYDIVSSSDFDLEFLEIE